jgi:hypothetical protein
MAEVHSAESARAAIQAGDSAAWVRFDEVDDLELPGGCIWRDRAQVVNGELAMCLKHVARQRAIRRFENGEPVTDEELDYAIRRLLRS